ncbi:MAG: peptide-methionine (S)-S-oxide reductase [Desulfobacterales bacterium]
METVIIAMMVLPFIFLAAAMGMAADNLEKATFAGGCFWCMEHPFDRLPGVVSVTSGYTGGHKKNPAYIEAPSFTIMKSSTGWH